MLLGGWRLVFGVWLWAGEALVFGGNTTDADWQQRRSTLLKAILSWPVASVCCALRLWRCEAQAQRADSPSFESTLLAALQLVQARQHVRGASWLASALAVGCGGVASWLMSSGVLTGRSDCCARILDRHTNVGASVQWCDGSPLLTHPAMFVSPTAGRSSAIASRCRSCLHPWSPTWWPCGQVRRPHCWCSTWMSWCAT